MSRAQVGAVAHHLRRVFGQGTVAGLAEWELLRRYLERGDEEAFGAIVARHGPMVLGVCRRVLGESGDSDDAFQVTFLTLARKAGTLGEGDAIGSWLYGVAHRVSLRARAASARRRNLERKATVAGPPSQPDEPARREQGSIVAEELAGLPPKYRAPMVLCYIEGLTHEEAAGQLGWPVGTVKGRLSRARDLLKGRLERRGLAPAHGSSLALLIRGDLIRVPASLAARTTRAVLDFAAGRAAEGLSASAVALLETGVESMIRSKFMAVVATLCLFGGGVAVMAYQAAKEPAEKAKPAESPTVDVRKVNPPVDPALVAEPSTTPKPTRPGPRLLPGPSSSGKVAIGPANSGGFDGGSGEADPLARLRAEAAQPRPAEPKNSAIFAKLDERISMNFPNPTPFEDVKKYVEQCTQDEKAGLPTGIPIYVDPQALMDSGSKMASTITMNLEGIPLKVTLGLALKQLNLGYRIKDGVMIICLAADGGGDSPLSIMLEKADRGELTRAEYQELVEILKLRKQVSGLQLIEDPHP